MIKANVFGARMGGLPFSANVNMVCLRLALQAPLLGFQNLETRARYSSITPNDPDRG